MCGIAGVHGLADESIVQRMIAAERHRGPDAQSVWSDPSVPLTLGHARLSIIDLSDAATQPMSYADGRLVVVYNGEIFNYRELRRDLESKGHRFKTTSDTEVLLASYQEWGPRCTERLRGMFAFALADKAPPDGAPELVLARDRLGIKPLLYFESGNHLFFASEVRALLATGRLPRNIDVQALRDFIAMGCVIQPRTAISGVKALPPGHLLEIYRNGRALTRYWDLHGATTALRVAHGGMDAAEASRELRRRLETASKLNLIADVPVGAFLSGGLDSSAVVALMSRETAHPIRTFAVGFESRHAPIDERPYARLVAKHLGADHSEVVITGHEVAERFAQTVSDLDQPSLDGFNTWFVSRAARSAVTVALSGLGGDELFAGYPHFVALAEAETAEPLLPELQSRFWDGARAALGRHRGLVFQQELRSRPQRERYALLRRVLSDTQLARDTHLARLTGIRTRFSPPFLGAIPRDADAVQRTTIAELSGYLLSTLLRDADVMSMAHGLEVRPVLLDHELVEFAYSLPQRLKLNPSHSKPILADAVRDLLPASVFERKKMGFSLPYTQWLTGPLKDRVRELLNTRFASALFEEAYRERLLRNLARERPDDELWAWTVLLEWCEQLQMNPLEAAV